MRKILIATAVGSALGAAMLAHAASPNENSLQAKAYMHFNFGGNSSLPSNFHYGLRLDQDPRFLDVPMPSLMQMDFNQYGFNLARLNGLPVAQRSYTLNAVGAVAAATTVVDWSMIAIGAVGVGFATKEAIDNSKDEVSAPASGGSTGGGSTTGGTTGSTTGSSTGGNTTGGSTGGNTTGSTTGSTTGNTTGSTTGGSTTGGSTTGGSTTGGLLGLLTDMSSDGNAERMSREYSEWLDGGNGQMGDLSAAR